MSSEDRRSPEWLGRVWELAGVVGVAASLVGGIYVFAVLGGWGDSFRRSLEVTSRAVSTVNNTLTVVDDAFSVVDTTVDTVDGSLSNISQTLLAVDNASTTLQVLLTEDLPADITAIRSAMGGLIGTAGVVDGILSALAVVGLPYDPDVPLDEALTAVDQRLGDLPDRFGELSDDLGRASSGMVPLAEDVDMLRSDLIELRIQLGVSSRLVREYADAASEADQVVADALDRVDGGLWLPRLLALVLGLTLATVHWRLYLEGRALRPERP